MQKGNWEFNGNTAEQFDEIAHKNIPHYAEVIAKAVLIAEQLFPLKNARVIDVGSATGYTMERFVNAGFRDVYGVDNSQPMLLQSRVQTNLIHSDAFPKSQGPFHIVVANWTLHFVNEREEYLTDIFDALHEDGVLFLSDKMQSSDLVHDRYHDFKRSMGLTEEQIAKKAAAIEGVLIPYPLNWYIDTLHRIGFKTVEIVDASWCFKSLLCIK